MYIWNIRVDLFSIREDENENDIDYDINSNKDILGRWDILSNDNCRVWLFVTFLLCNLLRIIFGFQNLLEYEYYSGSEIWPNTNTNTIQVQKFGRIRIRILFGFRKMAEYEYE